MNKKDLLANQIQMEFDSLYQAMGNPEAPKSQMCLYWAMVTIQILEDNGIPAILQAGSAQWRFLAEKDDNGQSCTHFGYIYNPRDLKSILSVALGFLPEMHVWVAIPDKDPKKSTIIDMTSPYFKELAIESGFNWTMPDPPKYLWVTIEEFEADKYFYIPDPDAIYYIISKWKLLRDTF